MFGFAKKLNALKFRYSVSEFRVVVPVILFIFLCGIVAVFFTFCGKTKLDLRTLVPKDTIIYLETNNLEDTLNALAESKSFKENAVSAQDFSVADGLQVAIAVSGFEASENQVTDEQSVLNFNPKFTVIAETHAWSWQVNSLVENTLNQFVKKTYGNDTRLERRSVNNTERFTWTATDGRKTFAVISNTQIFFGNDEESINKCLTAKRGESESLLKNENLASEYAKAKGKLAFGFISNEGIKQIADFVGVSVAVGQSEDENARGFISRILPQILNNTTREITWTAEKNKEGIDDRVYIKTEKEVADVLSETLVQANSTQDILYDFIPLETSSVTRYNLKDPRIAFRSLLLITAKNTDAVNGKIIAAFSNSLLASYGIIDAEGFLNGVDSEIITARIDEDGDKSLAIVKVKDFEATKKTISDEINMKTENESKIWKAEDEDFSVAFVEDVLILGDTESVNKSVEIYNKRKLSPIESNKDFTKSPIFNRLRASKATSITLTKDGETSAKIINLLGKAKENNKLSDSYTFTETYFNKGGIERRYMSDFGFLGTIIEQFDNP